jgi:hypothetical protein
MKNKFIFSISKNSSFGISNFFKTCNWVEEEFASRRMYDYCQNFTYSRLTEKFYNLRYLINKKFLYYTFIGEPFIPSTGLIFNGRWLTKQPRDSNFYYMKDFRFGRGNGIELLETLNDVQEISKNNKFCFVVQSNIQRPLLYKNKKFDLRLYLILSSSDFQNFTFSFYRHGYVRLSGEEYRENLDKFTQLTNTCHSAKKNNLSEVLLDFDESFEYYNIMQKILHNLYFKIVEKSKDKIKDINCDKVFTTILGLDVIFDAYYNPYVLEINYKPVLRNKKITNKLLKMFVTNYMEPLLSNKKIIEENDFYHIKSK